MKVAANRIVEIKYTLREGGPEGEILEVMDEHWPFKFLFGADALLPAFEASLEGLSNGSLFAFQLPADQAYGETDPALVIQVFKDDIEEDHRYPLDNYEVGDRISLVHKGQELTGVLKQIESSYILVDCNHSMTGMELYFEGQVLHVREARPDELVAKRYIEPNGFRSHSTLREPPGM